MAPHDGPTDPEYAAADEGIDFRRRIGGELPFLRRIARRWHRDQANADDLIQETLLRALPSIGAATARRRILPAFRR